MASSASSPSSSTNEESFPVSRLLALPGLVVVYSKEFVDDFATERGPRSRRVTGKTAAGRKRYALILKSAKGAAAKGELENYFDAVLQDILNVRQVSQLAICLHLASREIADQRSTHFLLVAQDLDFISTIAIMYAP